MKWWNAFLARNAADSLIMAYSRHTALAFTKMQGQKLLTFRRCTFSGHSSDVVATIFE